ncbi:hypothetical protein [Streptomyces scabiei]|uniref:hypothetical protein n=1 Tax=Streptomyces scabiei TaxID=1930 RepID=UPI0029BDC2B5|nr:hypothetical protein [Streptomyces scabiei]MDX2531598.1 hypothetical protein [Streptomyces scabiei]MDX2796656.1 hypothetical protein [Streptomyces scabiei]MDX2856163.1 hypothetical protein [Streptomyces scabiei]MDX3824556.1 hypothetical protein [Streptomyces scabiei]
MSQNTPAASACANLDAAIREIAPTTILARVYPERRTVTHLFESDFYRMLIDRRAEERVAHLIRKHFGSAADWRRAHDFYLPTGTLYLTPEPHQNGYIPEDDHSFGLSIARRIAIADGGR